ncbi:MAG: hypothetical protein EP338_06790 [Bacteroidetes bacterium]|nr:MAG: hypothetical protein EP338_06790 [Bacteroidota bacterium]
MKQRPGFLLHPLFLCALTLMILNDHWWKPSFHNELTGKLSDFAGILVLGLFLRSMPRISRTTSVIVTAILFIFWKSPFSQGLIDWWNSFAFFPVWRSIDYTDLFALSFLPIVYFLPPQKDFKVPSGLVYLSCFVSVLALCATSPQRYYFPMNTPIRFESKLNADDFIEQLASSDLLIPKKIDTLRRRSEGESVFYDLVCHLTYESKSYDHPGRLVDSCLIQIYPIKTNKIKVSISQLYLRPGFDYTNFYFKPRKRAYRICSKIRKEELR